MKVGAAEAAQPKPRPLASLRWALLEFGFFELFLIARQALHVLGVVSLSLTAAPLLRYTDARHLD